MQTVIDNCPLSYVCDEKWEELIETPNPDIKHCSKCATNVHWVKRKGALNEAKSLGRCVAFNRGLPDGLSYSDDGTEYTLITMGRF